MNPIQNTRPDLAQVPSFYHNYIRQVEGNDLIALLQEQDSLVNRFFASIADAQWDYRYAPGKWTINELVQHMIDAERIFAYRALRFARFDKTELPGFDENHYNQHAQAARRTKEDLVAELKVVQEASLLLFQTFDEDQLQATGISNGSRISVRAIGFITVGHARHHKRIVQERYGIV